MLLQHLKNKHCFFACNSKFSRSWLQLYSISSLTLVAQMVKHLPAMQETWVWSLGLIPGFDPWVGKIPWRRKWRPTPVLLPGKFHAQKSLVGYSPWGCKESDTTEPFYFTSLILSIIHCLSASMLFPYKYFKYLYLLDALQPHIHIDILFSIVFHL